MHHLCKHYTSMCPSMGTNFQLLSVFDPFFKVEREIVTVKTEALQTHFHMSLCPSWKRGQHKIVLYLFELPVPLRFSVDWWENHRGIWSFQRPLCKAHLSFPRSWNNSVPPFQQSGSKNYAIPKSIALSDECDWILDVHWVQNPKRGKSISLVSGHAQKKISQNLCNKKICEIYDKSMTRWCAS